MSEWKSSTIDSVVTLLRRGTAPVYVDSSAVIAIGQRCVRNEGFDVSPTRSHMESAPVVVAPVAGDVLLNSTGTGTIGRSCVFPSTSGRFMIDGHVTVLRGDSELVDGRILNALLQSPIGQRLLETRCFTGSTNQVELSRSELAKLEFSLPPLEEQRRIAEILDTIDETIQATERVIAKLVTARTALTHTLLGGAPVKRSIRLGELALSSVDGPFGSGLTSAHYVDGPGVRVVRLSNLGDGEFINNDKAYVSENYATTLGRHDARPGDLLIASLGDERHRPGRACMYPTGERDGIVKADCFRFRLDQSIAEPAFVMCRINQHDIGRQIARLSGGVTRDRVNLGNLRTIEIPLPPIGDQRSIVDLLSDSAVQIKQENDRLTKHRKLRSGVASDLLSGRVRTVAL